MPTQKSRPSAPMIAAPAIAGNALGCNTRLNGFYTLWMAILATAIVAAGFGLSFLAYAKLTTYAPEQTVETLGDPWDAALP